MISLPSAMHRGAFIITAIVTPSERNLANHTSVQWQEWELTDFKKLRDNHKI